MNVQYQLKMSLNLRMPLNVCFFVYSYDSRQSATEEVITSHQQRPDLWSEPSAFGDRAHFRVSTRPAVLSVTGVRRFDAGTYTCRVDFRQSPTVYHHVTLDVIGEFHSLCFVLIFFCVCFDYVLFSLNNGKCLVGCFQD